MSDRRKIIMDVDTGSDDAIAIMTAILSPEKLEVLGIVSVNGNCPLPNTTENTLRVVDLLKSDVPVVMGCSTPLVANLDHKRRIKFNEYEPYIADGTEKVKYHSDYLDTIPPSVSKPVDENFISWYINTIKNAGERVTLVPVGPLTNIAMLLRADPTIVDYIEEIVIMGGGYKERNTSSAAEFNIYLDPEAAQIVLTCGAKITLCPLDATHRANLEPKHSKIFREMGTKAAAFAADMIDERVIAYNLMQPLHRPDIAPMHDALCIAYLLDPTVITTEFMRVDVDFGGGISDGETVIDRRLFPVDPKNCYVALDTDEEKFATMIVEILGRARD